MWDIWWGLAVVGVLAAASFVLALRMGGRSVATRRAGSPATWLLALFPVFLAAGCGETPPPSAPRATQVSREGNALLVTLDRPLDLARCELFDTRTGSASQVWTFTAGPRLTLRLEPAPPPGPQCLRLIETHRVVSLVALVVPQPAPGGVQARIELPMGAPPSDEPVWLPAGAPATLAYTLDCEIGLGRRRIVLFLPLPLEPDPETASRDGWKIIPNPREWVLAADVDLRAGDRVQRRLTLLPRPEAAGQTLTVRGGYPTADQPGVVQARVFCAAATDIERFVGFTETRLPANRFGDSDPTRRADVILMPTRLGRRLRGWFGGEPVSETGEEPFTYQALTVKNDSEAALAVEVRARVVHAGGEAAPAFAPPPALGAGGDAVTGLALVPPHASRQVVLPVFVRPEVLPGEYRRQADLRLLGSQAVLSSVSAPLWVELTDRPPLYLVLAAVLVTVLALPVLAWRARSLLGRFANVELIQMALFGSAAFLLVGVPARLLAVGLSAALPVVSPFLLGLYSQTVSAAILGALVVLVPRPGVALLAGGVRFLLNGILFGSLSPVDILYAVPALLVSEALLWACGLTRGRPLTAVRLALAFAGLGLAGAALELSIEMTLYRLFFADWYVVLFLALNGTLYPALGAVFGARLGETLRKTAE